MLTGVTAIVLMLAGGLNALQNTVIVTSAPFLVIIAGLAVSFWREIVEDRRAAERALGATPVLDHPARDLNRGLRPHRPQGSPSPPARRRRNDMPQDNRKDRVTKAWAAAWDRGEVDALDSLLSPEYRRRGGPTDAGQSLAEFKASIITARSAFPDLITTIDEMVDEGDRLAIRWHSTGLHERPFLGVPATGRSVEVNGATFARFENDVVVEEFVTWDPRALLTALGIIHVGEDR